MRIYILTLLFCIPFITYCQTHISGKVIDEDGNPIPYANVIFPNTTIGTSTDEQGKFSLHSEKKHREIEVSFIGYTTNRVSLSKANLLDLTIVLVEGETLTEVTVVGKPKKALSKKENPAYPILKGIWKNKSKRGLHNSKAYEYKRHHYTELGLNNLDTIFLQTTLGEEYDTVRKILSEKKYKEHFSIPMYLKETIEKVYENNLAGKKRVDIEAERSQGIVQEGFGLERISRAFDEFEIYDNSYIILNKPFVGPLSEFGYGTYHYVLSDSISENNRMFYQIHFFPKSDEDLALEGFFTVDSKTFIIKSIEMKTTPKTNINMVRSLFFEKHFAIENDSVYYPVKEIQEGDFTLITKKEDEKGLYVHNEIYFSEVMIDNPKPASFYEKQTPKVSKNQFVKENSYWSENATTSDRLNKTKMLIQEVGNNRRIKLIADLTDIIGSGYISVGKYLKFGNFGQIFSRNDVEGGRLRAGFKTYISTEDRFRSYFYGAYGLRDHKLKYGISAKYLLTHAPRITFGASFQNDNLQLGSFVMHDDTRLDFGKTTNFIIARGENYYLTNNKKWQSSVTIGLHKNFEISFFGTHQKTKPANEEHFSITYKNPENQEIIKHYNDFSTGLVLSYTPKRNVYGYGVEQRFGKKLFSTYQFKYTKGVKGVFDSQFDYDKLQFLVQKPIPVFGYGLLLTSIEAGKIFGTVPLTVLSPTPANQSFSTAPNTFVLLDYYDFVTDTYINGYFEHHFEGLIFNRIPRIKEARLRSLIFARFAYGTISDKNKNATISNVVFNAPNKLYWEYGFGIENIGLGNFRFIRLDFVWRSDFNDVNGVRNPKFGIRLGIAPVF
ncbi:DUF5686 and carboxypeptidase-like regulatory domain-containing protein [Capnocytophaga felis]|uniref:Membrane protein n=1 Tax=Capnocytophaga felis TaxID=2267611 RepID=A0A5M4B8B4_9FLAO|nr:DUF5686 and carboxypeptidase-like regulatory domain-containing protein [Capnocytophaga felis]GET45829.1 membrane protein [Capnocytophaga felis]GET49318.1 membrane protein [Capnocytophaga felis]